jgi:SHS2 domain-containing protein
VVPHTADLAFEVHAKDWPGLLVAATLALSDLVRTSEGGPRPESRRVEARGADREDVLVAWLSEVVYHFERDGFLPEAAVVEGAGTASAEGTLFGRRLDREREAPDRVVKAVTYHDLAVVEGAGGRPWSARVVLDL